MTLQSGDEKKQVYNLNFGRYNKAKSSGFYLECLWILYSFLEERSSAFLYHVGVTSEKDRKKVTSKKFVVLDIRKVFNLTNENSIRYNLDSLSGKLMRIKQILDCNYDNFDTKDQYMLKLQNVAKEINSKKEYLTCLEYLQNQWRQERNELTHALFSKKYFDKYDELLPIIDAGYNNIRVFDNMVKLVKRKKIRKLFKIQ